MSMSNTNAPEATMVPSKPTSAVPDNDAEVDGVTTVQNAQANQPMEPSNEESKGGAPLPVHDYD